MALVKAAREVVIGESDEDDNQDRPSTSSVPKNDPIPVDTARANTEVMKKPQQSKNKKNAKKSNIDDQLRSFAS